MRLVKTISVSLLLTLLSVVGYAQKRVVTGSVLDTKDQPVIGAAVIVSGTSNGVMTDADGSFVLNVPSGEVTLDVSSLGYTSKQVKLTGLEDNVRVILAEDRLMLEETVVVGYGTQKKVNLTGAIGVVDSKELKDRTAHNLSGMLQGAVPGLNITTSSGNPGSSGKLNIRGIGSISSTASPLVMIDGVEGSMDSVNPNDVESISVIKDAAAAAVYGARGSFGVILITTRQAKETDRKPMVRYSGRFGWESPTTSTEFEDTGYWSVYTVDKFFKASNGKNYTRYTERDMMELLARVNDKTEHPDRPWVVVENRAGKDQYIYYANTDWYHEMYNDVHPVQQHSLSLSGGSKVVKYFLSGAYDRQVGILKQNPDIYNRYNLRSKISIKPTKWLTVSNNTAFFTSTYDYVGALNIENGFAYGARHALSSFPLKNPDGTWVYKHSLYNGNYAVANGRHIINGEGKHTNLEKKFDLSTTTEVKIQPIKQFSVTANYTYRMHQNRYTRRSVNVPYSPAPGQSAVYDSGAGENSLSEEASTWDYHAVNVFANYEDTFKDAHHLSAVIGMNMETQYKKTVGAKAYNLISNDLSDLGMSIPKFDDKGGRTQIPEAWGGQSSYALLGFFARINYDYKGRYLFELAGRYDGSSRFAKGHRWGFFPSGSLGWRISEEPFFAPAKDVVSNLKLRLSVGSLGNQQVGYYDYLRTIKIDDFKGYSFGGGSLDKYATLSAPNASDLTWETANQYNLGLDMGFLEDRLSLTVEGYIRDTKNMLTAGVALPGIYGAPSPKMNAADLRTKGYELSIGWRDEVKLGGHPFGYSARFTLSDNKSIVTKFDNPEKTFAKEYYEGMEIGEIWGFVVDGLFQSDAEAQAYAEKIDLGYIENTTKQWGAGDPRYVDLQPDNIISIGANTVNDPGDRKKLGNALPHLQYGINLGLDYFGFDFSIFLQGTGNHYWYPDGESMAFWGPYSRPYLSYLPKNFLDNCWSPDNPDAYFPKPAGYAAFNSKGHLHLVNSRYLQNIRYLRLKNLTVGYSVPVKALRKIGMEKLRVYFSGENLAYSSPIKKHSKYVDPEAAIGRSKAYNNAFYPWQKTFMFGIDITF